MSSSYSVAPSHSPAAVSLYSSDSTNTTLSLFGPPPLEQVLMPVGTRYPLAEYNFSIADVILSGYSLCKEAVSEIFNRTFGTTSEAASSIPEESPVPVLASQESCASIFGYPRHAESMVTTSGSKIFLSPTLASSSKLLSTDWEKHAGGIFWDYHSSIENGPHSTFHRFTLKPNFSLSDPRKKQMLRDGNSKAFPAIFVSSIFLELNTHPEMEYLKRLGYSYDEEKEIFQVPSLRTLMTLWDEFRLERPELPGLYFILCEGVEEDSEFTSNWINGAISVSINTEYEHDTSNHVMSTLKLLTRLKNKADVDLYLKASKTNSAVLSQFFEMLKGSEGKVFTDTLLDQYLEKNPSVKISDKENLRLRFHRYCHTALGFLADGFPNDTLKGYLSATHVLCSRPSTVFNLRSEDWNSYFFKRYGFQSTYLFEQVFIEELIKSIKSITVSD